MEGTGDKGYISGDGRVTQLLPEEREEPIVLSGEDLDGEVLDVEDFRGKPVVIVVWGAWCPPCRAEAPAVVDAAEQLGEDVQFVGIDIRDSSPEQAKSFVRTFDVPYPSFYSPDGKAMLPLSGTLTPNSVPSFVVLDQEGRVAASILGELPSTTTLVEITEDVLAESEDG